MIVFKMSDPKSLGEIIGDWGRWQTNVFMFAIVNYILQSYNSMSYSFYAPTTNFWCADYPESQVNILLYVVPGLKFRIYFLQQFLTNINSWYLRRLSFTFQNETLTATQKCNQFADCKKWVFDDSFDSTIISEVSVLMRNSLITRVNNHQLQLKSISLILHSYFH